MCYFITCFYTVVNSLTTLLLGASKFISFPASLTIETLCLLDYISLTINLILFTLKNFSLFFLDCFLSYICTFLSGLLTLGGVFNLSTMRSLLQTYKGQHRGNLPIINASQSLEDVFTNKTKMDGTVDNTDGIYGPYVLEFPENSYSASNAVKVITNDPPVVGDVTADNAGGWLYNDKTGGIWLDRDPGYTW